MVSDGTLDAGVRLLPLQDVSNKRTTHLHSPTVPVVSLYVLIKGGLGLSGTYIKLTILYVA